jgi:hypothetical protein
MTTPEHTNRENDFPPELSVGDTFEPFAGYIKPDILQSGLREFEPVFNYVFTFSGVPFAISLVPATEPENRTDIATPLGKVTIIKEIDGNDTKIVDSPVELEISAVPQTAQQYRKIQEFAIEFEISGEKYEMRCGGDWPTNPLKDQFENRGEPEKITTTVMHSNNLDETSSVLLPNDSILLSPIKARIIEKQLPSITIDPRA